MRRVLVVSLTAIALWGCEQRPYRYPPPVEAPMAPPQPAARPAPPPVYTAPARPKAITPLGQGPLTAKIVEPYMDAEEHQLRADLRGGGVGVGRPGDEIDLYLRSNVLFEKGGELSRRGEQIILAISADLVRYDSTAIAVNGFTDTVDTPDEQMQRAQAQADAVAKALAADGVDPRRITVKALGAQHLKIPTAAGTSEPRNRRVEIVITPKMKG